MSRLKLDLLIALSCLKPYGAKASACGCSLQARNRLYLVMEYCGGGDMADYIRRHKQVSESVARAFMQQLGAGLQELWRHHFVHVRLLPCQSTHS